MDKYTASELSYKNGYEKGYADGNLKWIDVNNKLPNYFGSFIVAVKEGTGNQYSDYACYDPYQQKWKTGLLLGRMDMITHWMPLPEPPKEGKE